MKRLPISVIISLLLGYFPLTLTKAQVLPTSPAQTSDRYADKLRTFEEFVRQQMEKNKIPGLTIGFIKDDYVWVKGFGFADVENKIPAQADSAYRLASVQKSMTAVAILQLVEQGKINLDAEIQTYVHVFHARLVAGVGSCAPLMPIVGRLPVAEIEYFAFATSNYCCRCQ